MTKKSVSFEDVNKVNEDHRSFTERRVKLLELLYGEDAKARNAIPTRWLDEGSRVAAQSLVDSHVAKFDAGSEPQLGEVLRARHWIIPRSLSIKRLASN